MGSKFYQKVKDSKLEREVEFVYNEGIELYFPDARIEHPYDCDGYIETKVKYNEVSKILRLIMEFKLDENLSEKTNKIKVLIQVLYYLKRFEIEGKPLPNVILVGDKKGTFVIHSNDISNYLGEDLDWSIAPSMAYSKNPDLILKMSKDSNINPFLFSIDNNFSFKTVTEKIKDLTLNIQRHVRITEHNIAVIYEYFINKVIKNSNKLDTNKLVYIFIDLMIRPNETYKHPFKKNTLVLSDGEIIPIKGDSYDAFVSYFERKYKPSEKENFTAIADRLIEDTKRRFKGEFYTPTLWADEAHKEISSVFGEKWRDEYVVWDCAWGTGNLTRDYKFNELYCSTINETDLEIGKKYNSSSVKFQYDFLNDDIDLLEGKELLENNHYKLPKSLLNALKNNKPIIFLINPPYGTANNAGVKKGDHKAGIALTQINRLMKQDKTGAASQQLYAQFLYRIMKMKKVYGLTNVSIALFSPTIFLTGSQFKQFRREFLKEFEFNKGMIFKASHFADVKGIWGIDFSIWSTGETLNKNEFEHTIKDLDSNNEIVTIESKYIYNIDCKKNCSDWIKEDIRKLKTEDAPQLGSALIVKSNGIGKLAKNSLGYYVNVGNSVYKNNTDVFLVSSTSSMGHGISILPINFFKVVVNFSARKLISGKYSNWINQKDEYLIPNVKHKDYHEFESDSLIYSIFNTASNQSSLRNVEYLGDKWDIKNEFFFMSVSDIQKLSDEYENDDVYNDIKENGQDRFVYKKLKTLQLSIEAKLVLDAAISLTKKSFKYRDIFNEEKPEYQINTWDAGWYQIKGLLRQYMQDEYDEFIKLYKILEDKMRPLVYELNFLNSYKIPSFKSKEIVTEESLISV